MNIFLLLAGDYAAPGVLPQADDVVIAVDGGIRHAQTLGISPHLWIGDFDSADSALREKYAHIPRHAFPADKDQTDFELALAYAARHHPHGVRHIIGSGGDEADHAFANLWVLPQSAAPCVLWRKNAVIVAGAGPLQARFAAPKGSKVSLFALTALRHVTSDGLRWPLHDESLAPFVARAARNETVAETASLRWQTGQGLLFLPPSTEIIDL